MKMNDPAVLAEVETVFAEYERALMANDIATLDALFADTPGTVRYGTAEHLYGPEEIAAFRRARTGGSPPRTVTRHAVASYGHDFATTHIEFRRPGTLRIGRQTQAWVRTDDGWRIVSAHVSFADV